MKRRCIVLFSGGLDSMLAVRILQEQGVIVEAVNFKTAFTCCQDVSAQAAHRLGIQLTVLTTDNDYLDLVRKPRWGYGKGANPCVDCRIYMFERALHYLKQSGAAFMASGEVVGQRPMSQKRRDLDVIAFHSGCEDLLLRPLSAKQLPPTLPEREGWVDREQLYDIVGRSRKELIKLARQFGIEEIPQPINGLFLDGKAVLEKVFDLIQLDTDAAGWDFELLKTGRHFRVDEQTKLIVGRHTEDNLTLRYMHELPESRTGALLEPDGFPGPSVMIIGPVTQKTLDQAAGMIVRYAISQAAVGGRVKVSQDGRDFAILGQANEDVQDWQTVAEGA